MSFLLVLPATSAAAQVFSAGVKAGTPLTTSRIVGRQSEFGVPVLDVRRYTVGPTVEIALPFRLRFQGDVLYKRLDETTHVRARGGSPPGVRREAANSWEFPMALKYAWKVRRVRPFALAGGTFRRINSFEYSEERLGSPSAPYSVVRGRIEEPLTQGGWVAGGGVRFDIGRLKISPEIRYTRWTSLRFFPTQNQVEFLIAVMF